MSDLADWAQMLVALGALAFAIHEASESRKDRRMQRQAEASDQRLRVRPKLVGNWDVDYEKRSILLAIVNVGLGPAIVQRYQHTIDGHEVDELDGRLVVAELGLERVTADNYLHSFADYSIPVGGEVRAIAFRDIEWSGDLDLLTLAQRLGVNIRYQSIYDEQFELRGPEPSTR